MVHGCLASERQRQRVGQSSSGHCDGWAAPDTGPAGVEEFGVNYNKIERVTCVGDVVCTATIQSCVLIKRIQEDSDVS